MIVDCVQGVQLYTLHAKNATRGYCWGMEDLPRLNDAFGQTLRQHRENAGLTQVELAEKIGASLSAIKKLEAGDRIPSLKTVLMICRGLDVPPQDFVADVARKLSFLEGQ